jgi:hypothetical protein
MTINPLLRAALAAVPLLASAVPATAQAAAEEKEARALLQAFVRPGADHAALSRKLRPTRADYDAVFTRDAAARLQAVYDPAWEQGALVVKGKPGQTEVLLFGAGSADIKAWNATASRHFPGGCQSVGPYLQPGVRLYAFKFVEPGQALGMAFDGLVRVNGQWRIFPKAWRALR